MWCWKPRTPEVDLYDGPNGARVQTLKDSQFPACAPITGRAPNMMLRVNVSGTRILGAAAYGEIPLRRKPAAGVPQSLHGQQ